MAPDFPPAVGGMEEYASALAEVLASHDDVVVFTKVGRGLPDPPYVQQATLTGQLRRDLAVLARTPVDVWLGLNAGLAALAPRLSRPLVVCAYGNDFLTPWVSFDKPLLDGLRRMRWLWRAEPRLRRIAVMRDLRRGFNATSAIIASSTATAKRFDRAFPHHRHKLAVISPGVRDCFFQDKIDTGGLPFNILTVSRLSTAARRKNVEGVLKALTILPPSVTFRYTVVGDGDDRIRLQELARQSGLGERVQFLGKVSLDRLLECYRRADLFVLASKAGPADFEGFGLVYLEASAAGVPVICSAQGGATDAVAEDENGIVIPGSSPEDILQGILRMMRTRSLFPLEQVRAFAERFRWKHVGAQVQKKLRTVVRAVEA